MQTQVLWPRWASAAAQARLVQGKELWRWQSTGAGSLSKIVWASLLGWTELWLWKEAPASLAFLTIKALHLCWRTASQHSCSSTKTGPLLSLLMGEARHRFPAVANPFPCTFYQFSGSLSVNSPVTKWFLTFFQRGHDPIRALLPACFSKLKVWGSHGCFCCLLGTVHSEAVPQGGGPTLGCLIQGQGWGTLSGEERAEDASRVSTHLSTDDTSAELLGVCELLLVQDSYVTALLDYREHLPITLWMLLVRVQYTLARLF